MKAYLGGTSIFKLTSHNLINTPIHRSATNWGILGGCFNSLRVLKPLKRFHSISPFRVTSLKRGVNENNEFRNTSLNQGVNKHGGYSVGPNLAKVHSA